MCRVNLSSVFCCCQCLVLFFFFETKYHPVGGQARLFFLYPPSRMAGWWYVFPCWVWMLFCSQITDTDNCWDHSEKILSAFLENCLRKMHTTAPGDYSPLTPSSVKTLGIITINMQWLASRYCVLCPPHTVMFLSRCPVTADGVLSFSKLRFKCCSDSNPSLPPTELCHQSPLAGRKLSGLCCLLWEALISLLPLSCPLAAWGVSSFCQVSYLSGPQLWLHLTLLQSRGCFHRSILNTQKALNLSEEQTDGAQRLLGALSYPMRVLASADTPVPSTMFSVKRILMRRWLSGPSDELRFISQTHKI